MDWLGGGANVSDLYDASLDRMDWLGGGANFSDLYDASLESMDVRKSATSTPMQEQFKLLI